MINEPSKIARKFMVYIHVRYSLHKNFLTGSGFIGLIEWINEFDYIRRVLIEWMSHLMTNND